MKKNLIRFWHGLPIQLFLLHFRRHQVFLLIWYILFATVAGSFMRNFGAYSLFLAPEYFGKVSALSTAIVGFTTGVFIMSWNITTFILYSRHLRFLATTAQPFLKYCINNAIIPLCFLVFYFWRAYHFTHDQELFANSAILFQVLGYLGGFSLALGIAFLYFFGADKTIYYTVGSVITQANHQHDAQQSPALWGERPAGQESRLLRVDWFVSAAGRIRRPRDVQHYSKAFLDNVFQRHHVAAVLAISIAFVFLIGVGYSSDTRLFQLPAAASITLFFAVLVAVAGAISLVLGTWSIPVLILLYAVGNYLYQAEWLDPRNKAYGLNYQSAATRPPYTQEAVAKLLHPDSIAKDKAVYYQMLEAWKARQLSPQPIMFLISTSGGGTRSAAFTMNALQALQKELGDSLMQKTFLISGASGGMLGAAYFRALYAEKQNGQPIDLTAPAHVEAISKDLLSPLFSSFLTRDLLGPIQKFARNGFLYNKDRGYAFEQQLSRNTQGLLNRSLLADTAAERAGKLPAIIYNAAITRDGRKLIVASRPSRFLMRPAVDPRHLRPFDADALDFQSFFAQQSAAGLNTLTALRMNATFPYVLPNVWLPSNPIIDVMDAGLRDNFGQETALRFLQEYKDWLLANTAKIVLIQIRDRGFSDWEKPLESKSLLGYSTQPFLILQNNWYKMQDYYQHDQLDYVLDGFNNHLYRVAFQYVPGKKEAPASLSFHLTAAEKRDIGLAMKNHLNQEELQRLRLILLDKSVEKRPE
ncbi:MAG: hypothetical protein EAZ62_06210 [Sphingobacteriia bacterium]|nr:MAG: hypothetical protein EAZ62_06210 [Sphingobacteriia bacterium]